MHVEIPSVHDATQSNMQALAQTHNQPRVNSTSC